MPNGILITAFDGGSPTSITGTTAGVGNQSVSLSFPANTSTTTDKVYTIKASLDGGATWDANVTVVTVTPPQPTANPSVTVTAPLNLDLNGQASGSVQVSLGMSGGGTMATHADVEIDQNGVAEVSHVNLTDHGNVTVSAKSVGNATVTVRFYDANGEMTAHTASIPVTVTDSTPAPPPVVNPPFTGSSSSSSKSGSTTLDGIPGQTTPAQPKPVTKQKAEKALNDAIAKLPAGSFNKTLDAVDFPFPQLQFQQVGDILFYI